MKNRLMYIIAAVVAVAVLAIGGGIYWKGANNYVATVAGEKITKAEFNFFLTQAKQEMESNAGVIGDESKTKAFWESKIDGKDAKVKAKEDAIKLAKEYKINLIKAKENKIALTKDETNEINSNLDQMIQSQGGRNKTEELLKTEYRITLSEYKDIYKDFMVIRKFMQEEQKKQQINEEDVKKFYSQKDEKAAQTTVRHILISTVDAERKPLPADKQETAKKKADEVLAKVKAGGDMKALAKEYSEDPGSKETAGEYTFPRGQMMPEFENWAFKAKVGDTGIVQTTYGYHVMKKPTYEEINADSRENIKSEYQYDKIAKELEKLENDPKYDAKLNQRVFDAVPVI